MAVLHMNDERLPCRTKHCVIPSLAVFHSPKASPRLLSPENLWGII